MQAPAQEEKKSKREKQPDGSTIVTFTTKDGKQVTITRKPKKTGKEKKTPSPEQAASPTSPSSSKGQQNERPTNLLPILDLSTKRKSVPEHEKPKHP